MVLSQTNTFDKLDEIYVGFVRAATADFTPTVNMTPIADDVINGLFTMVAQAVEALFNDDNATIALRAHRKRAEKAKLPPELDGASVHTELPDANMPEMPSHANMSEMPAPPAYSDTVELKATF
ncbi:uncharacterized protein N0V89_012116 [Didymosphaeria variabile]|uniref:Rax2-like third domain-containing protein n=1 Tax=Didymosphaeria variabile TaxID=1932322 RepID=A0A9W8X8Z2_9PLEO|nr:uncharacterized protein N0V89_012116 [Didymosphaeria variabile]KAJ4344376.1 hypothetical protein N0V89_012116 [Didymosphaeria variabile]